jgi:hypothetical protein
MIGSVDESQSEEQDEVGFELNRFVQSLRIRLGDAAKIESEQLTQQIRRTNIVPVVGTACSVSIVEMGKVELIVKVAGGRWELGRSNDTLDFFKRIVESSIKGDVTEIFGLERVETRVAFPEGTSVKTTTRTLGGIFPTPGWRHWGRKVKYEPYQ